MSRTSSDRNLLFGILALQLNFVGRDQLIAGMNAWMLDKGRPLGQVLADQGALHPDALGLLDALVQKHLDLHGGDPARSLAALRSADAAREALAGVGDPDVQASLGHVSVATMPSTRGPSPAQGPAGPRYRVLRPHARGGLGEVFVARDEELHREVALKEIQLHRADDPDSRARFLLEAEVTGRLEHPGIVPVYGLGTYADGRPFYAMRFIQGDSLLEALRAFHRRAATLAPGDRTLELRKLLGRFVGVCNAVAYAHSRRVLHRDLKPGNIMLGEFGETLVVDWGLAKPLGGQERGPESTAPRPEPISAGGATPTQTGQAVGTPGYMSPEQAAGRLDELGPASDVYSLGVTLYHLLTGKKPFERGDVGEVLRRVQKGDFPGPRQVNPLVPAALEAVCLKAMALAPADRYASATDLAREVERFLADEPVTARREPWAERAWRWVRRHRAGVGAAAAGALAVLVTVSAALVLTDGLRRNAEGLAESEGRQRRKAEQAEEKAIAKARELERALYVNSISLAHQRWSTGDVAGALDLLERCPEELRHLEWHYLRRLCRQEALVFEGHRAPVAAVAFGPDGRVASADRHKIVHVWDADTGTVAYSLRDRAAVQLLWSPDGRQLAVACADDTVHVHDAAGGRAVHSWRAPSGPLGGLAYTADGRLLTATSDDAVVRVWDVRAGAEHRSVPFDGTGFEHQIALAPDGSSLLTGTGSTLYRHDLDSGRREDVPTLVARRTFRNAVRAEPFRLAAAAVHPFDRRVATASGWPPDEPGGAAFVADPGQERFAEPVTGHVGAVRAVAFSPDGQVLASAGADRVIRLWNARTLREKAIFRGHRSAVVALAFAPKGDRLASGSEDGTVRLWDLSCRPGLLTLWGHRDNPGQVPRERRDNPGPLTPKFSRDGGRLARSDGMSFDVWDLDAGRMLFRRQLETAVFDVGLSPDGREVAAADGQSVRAWEVDTGRPLPSFEAGAVHWVGYHADGSRLVTIDRAGLVRVWNRGRQEVARVQGRPDMPPFPGAGAASVFLPDGPTAVRVWDVASQAERGTRQLPAAPAGRFAADATGRLWLVGDGRNGLEVWDGEEGRARLRLAGHTGRVTFAQFSADGRRIVSAGADDTVRVWDAVNGAGLLALSFPPEWRRSPPEFFLTPDERLVCVHPRAIDVLEPGGPEIDGPARLRGRPDRLASWYRATGTELDLTTPGSLRFLFDRQVELKPEDPEVWLVRAELFEGLTLMPYGRWPDMAALADPLGPRPLAAAVRFGGNLPAAAAVHDLTQALGKDPDNELARRRRAALYARHGRWKEAAEDYRELGRRRPLSYQDQVQLYLMRLGTRDAEGVREAGRGLLAMNERASPAGRSASVALLLAMSPQTGDLTPQALALAEGAARQGAAPREPLALGATLYRAGRFAEAAGHLEKAAGAKGPDRAAVLAIPFLAMARHRLGQDREAVSRLEEFRTHVEGLRLELFWGRDPGLDLLLAELLYEEAQALVRPRP